MMGNEEQVSLEELSRSLAAYLSARAGQMVEVTSLERMSSGWESDVFAFEAPVWREGEHILRLYFGADAGPKAQHEFRALDMLRRAAYPVPKVHLVEPSPQALGRAFLSMERVKGVALGKLWRDPDAVVRKREMARFCELMATLHTLPWRHLPGADDIPSFTIEQQFGVWRGLGAMHPSKTLTAALAWLHSASASVTVQPLGLSHWDFHHENVLVGMNKRAWVIDWTQFQVTDTRFDLAWTLVLLASERDMETSQAVRNGYFAQRGWEADAVQPELDFFEAAACAKRLIVVLVSMGAGAESLGMRPGAEAVISKGFPRYAGVYQRWLALTATPLPEIEEMLAAHL